MAQKRRINIGTIGHVDHGKTTLSSAITKMLSNDPEIRKIIGNEPLYDDVVETGTTNKYFSYADIDNAPEERARGITINVRTVEIETKRYVYSLVDCPGHADFIKNMIVGAQNLDIALLVIDATQGVQIQTLEHLRLVKNLGVPKVIIVLTKCGRMDGNEGLNAEIADLAEEVAKEDVAKIGYTDVKCVRVSALEAINGDKKWMLSILQLMQTVENNIGDIQRDTTSPGKMLIETVHSIPGRGKVLAGPVSRGVFTIGQKVKIVLSDKIIESEIVSMEAFKKKIEQASAGDNIGMLARNVPDEVARGDKVVAADANIVLANAYVAELVVLTEQEGGRASPIFPGYRPQMYYETSDVTVKLKEDETQAPFANSAKPGEVITALFVLEKKQLLENNSRFTLREGGKTIGAGRVTKLIADYVDDEDKTHVKTVDTRSSAKVNDTRSGPKIAPKTTVKVK
jgi:elongation factor Tu